MSLLRKRRLNPLKEILPSNEELNLSWNNTWSLYTPILSQYYNIFELVDEHKENILIEPCEKIVLPGVPSYEAKGAKKYIEKCGCSATILCKGKSYAMNNNSVSIDELKNHLDILVLYYGTNDGANWPFKIPKLFYRKPINNMREFVMEFIHIDSATWMHAKNIEQFDEELQYKIGEFLGLYINSYKKILYEYELYKDITDNKYVLLDFGEFYVFNDFNNIKGKKFFASRVYDGIKSIINDNIEKIGYKKHTGGTMSYDILYNKYIKYKTKYLHKFKY